MSQAKWLLGVDMEGLPGGGLDCVAMLCAQQAHVAVRCGAVRCVSLVGVSTQASTVAGAGEGQGSRGRIADSSWRSVSSCPI